MKWSENKVKDDQFARTCNGKRLRVMLERAKRRCFSREEKVGVLKGKLTEWKVTGGDEKL